MDNKEKNIKISSDLHKRLRIVALEENTFMKDILDKALNIELEKIKRKRDKQKEKLGKLNE